MLRRHHPAEVSQEPVGIVISRGADTEVQPRFVAFEWSPVPAYDIELEPTATKAAYRNVPRRCS
jgi:hypothetical protein